MLAFLFLYSFLACLFLSFEIKYISKHSDIKKVIFQCFVHYARLIRANFRRLYQYHPLQLTKLHIQSFNILLPILVSLPTCSLSLETRLSCSNTLDRK